MSNFTLNALVRGEELQGKGSSRRLRKQNLVPSIIYGGETEPLAVSLKLNEVVKVLESESFFSAIVSIKLEDGSEEAVIIKDLQRHPSKGIPLHADFQRIVKGQLISMGVPVHFEGSEINPAIKSGASLSTTVVELDISCLPKNIPEYIVVDVSTMQIGDSLHLSDIKLPEGVLLDDLEAGTDRTVANLSKAKVRGGDEAPAEAETPDAE